MSTVHLFNPENDLALGLNTYCYTPRPNVAVLHRLGARLPSLWAESKDIVLPANHIVWGEVNAVKPWGWSLDAKRQLKNVGCPDCLLPSDETLALFRALSHRRNSIRLLRELNADFELPQEFFTADEALEELSRGNKRYIKSPWSGSGKGVICTSNIPFSALRKIIGGIIRRQGSVIVEKELEKKLDFAMLWQLEEVGAEFQGLSVFRIGNEGYYEGNLVGSQTQFQELIGVNIPIAELKKGLETVLKGYKGPVGVDMMVCQDGRVMPCVEINLRLTMGFAALALYKKLQGRLSDRAHAQSLINHILSEHGINPSLFKFVAV